MAFLSSRKNRRSSSGEKKLGFQPLEQRVLLAADFAQVAASFGDFDRNGMVDSVDYAVWRETLGSTIHLQADGNSNGIVDREDYGIWRSNFGTSTQELIKTAEIVEQAFADLNDNLPESTGFRPAEDVMQHGYWSFRPGQTGYGDVNGDGLDDMIFQSDNNSFWLSLSTGSGFATPTLAMQHGYWPFNPGQTGYGDVNGDGMDDMIFRSDNNSFWLSLSTGSGFATPTLAMQHGGPFVAGQTDYADVNGDGRDDMIFQGADNHFWLSHSTGDGFGPAVNVMQHGGPFAPGQTDYADINGDGLADMIFQGADNHFWLSLSTGDGFGPATNVMQHGGPFAPGQADYADINGDGFADMIFQGADNHFWLSLSTGDGFGTPTDVMQHGGPFAPGQTDYADVDGDGLADMIFQGTDNTFWWSRAANSGIDLENNFASVITQLSEGVQVTIDAGPRDEVFAQVYDGSLYALTKSRSAAGGTLQQFRNDLWNSLDSVHSFSLVEDTLSVARADHTHETLYLSDNLPASLQNSAESASSNSRSDVRSIIGGTISASDLDSQFENSSGERVSATLLASTGVIRYVSGDYDTPIGTGTLLAAGGNLWVLTADHVVDANRSNLKFSAAGETRDFSVVLGKDSFGGRDLALLKLSSSIGGIYGAILPDFQSIQEGVKVIQSGYGYDEYGEKGKLNFGFNVVDRVRNTAVTVKTGKTYQPNFAEYIYRPGEIATSAGDSGGPDIVPMKQVDRHGRVLWVPSVAAVHSYGTSTIDVSGDGEPDILGIDGYTGSTIIDKQVSDIIRNVVPTIEPTLVLEELHVIENGDSDNLSFAPAAEWYYAIQVNGVDNYFFRQFTDNQRYPLGHEFNLGGSRRVEIAFFGNESDEGEFLTGDDDSLGFWSTAADVPSRNLGERTQIYSNQIAGEGLSYELTFSIGW